MTVVSKAQERPPILLDQSLFLKDGVFSMQDIENNKRVRSLFRRIFPSMYRREDDPNLSIMNRMSIIKKGMETYSWKADAFSYFFFQNEDQKAILPFVYIERFLLGNIATCQIDTTFTTFLNEKMTKMNALTKELNAIPEKKLDKKSAQREEKQLKKNIEDLKATADPIVFDIVERNRLIDESNRYLAELDRASASKISY
jgi:hypothetical protein